MSMKMSPFLFLLLINIPMIASAQKAEVGTEGGVGGRRALVGGWQPIPDLQDKNVVGIGRFAVEEHNRKADSKLKFGGVVKGEQQVVSGMNYRLHLKVKNAGLPEKYVAVVYDKPWEKIRSLTSFHKLA